MDEQLKNIDIDYDPTNDVMYCAFARHPLKRSAWKLPKVYSCAWTPKPTNLLESPLLIFRGDSSSILARRFRSHSVRQLL